MSSALVTAGDILIPLPVAQVLQHCRPRTRPEVDGRTLSLDTQWPIMNGQVITKLQASNRSIAQLPSRGHSLKLPVVK